MAGQRNPRVVYRAALKTMASNVRAMLTSWQPPSTKYYPETPGGPYVWHNTPRSRTDIPAWEFPENDPAELLRLAQFMDAVIADATAVRAAALHRHAELTNE